MGVADVGGIKVERLVIQHQTFTQVYKPFNFITPDYPPEDCF